MAVTKLDARLLNRKAFDTPTETPYETMVWMTKMTGMMASSMSVSAFSWDASFVKTRAPR